MLEASSYRTSGEKPQTLQSRCALVIFSIQDREPVDVISFAPYGARAGGRNGIPMACAMGYRRSAALRAFSPLVLASVLNFCLTSKVVVIY